MHSFKSKRSKLKLMLQSAVQSMCLMVTAMSLSGARCRLFAYDPADATHTHTHTHLTALFRDYPGELVPER